MKECLIPTLSKDEKRFPQPDLRGISENKKGKTEYLLHQDYRYIYMLNGVIYMLWIREGFHCDNGSIPRIFWTLLGASQDGLGRAANVLHDFIYKTKGRVNDTIDFGIVHYFLNKDNVWQPVLNSRWSREQADKLFFKVLKDAGVLRRRSTKEYYAVRLFGWTQWRKEPTVTFLS